MRAITVKSVQILEEDVQLHLHHCFGMEQYSDYVFKTGGNEAYAATVVLESSDRLIQTVERESASFPQVDILIEDLDMDSNIATIYRIRNGQILDREFKMS